MITIENITFGYLPGRRVLSDFSLRFQSGGVYGLLGRNGTGKSTLLYLMSGLLNPQGGRIDIDGFNPQMRCPELLGEVFIVPEEYDLPRVTLGSYVKALKPFYPRFDEQLLYKMLADFDMAEDINLGNLSMGQKKKVYICVALAAGTRYLFMDEPTNGLDILSKSQFRKVVVQGMDEGRTIIISTHQVHDVENLLDHVVIKEPNKVLYDEAINVSEPVDLEKLFVRVLESSK